MALTGIAGFRLSGDQIEDVDIDDNAEIEISKLATRSDMSFSLPCIKFAPEGAGVVTTFIGVFGGMVLPDANTGTLRTSFALPDEWDSGNIVLVVWWTSAATAGNAKLEARIKSATAGGTTAAEETLTHTVTANGSANTLNRFLFTFAAADFTKGDIVMLLLTRNPADAADTIGADIRVHAIELSMTGRG